MPAHYSAANLQRLINRSRALDRFLVAAIAANKEMDRRMSLVGKMAALTERAKDFDAKTNDALDRIMAKMDEAEKKRDQAEYKHAHHLEGVIMAVEESIAVIDRLSNGPLDGSSGS